MIEKLRAMAIFAAVVDCGSFRAAARHLGLSPSRISQTVSDLERELGVTLLYRSTRQLSMTNEGHIFYAKVSEMLRAAETGLDAINQLTNNPAGELRVTAPAFVTQTGLMDTIADFARAYPGVALKLGFSDHPLDLIKEGFDVGIRAGGLRDSELMSRNIGRADRFLVASPDYVATRQAPEHPNDLGSWDWIHFSMRSERIEFTSQDDEPASITCKFRIEVDSADALYEFAVRGLGMTALPQNLAKRGFQHGELVQILPQWSVRPLAFHAVWPDRSRRESLTLIFVRFLAEKAEKV